MTRKFIIEVRDYESGLIADGLTVDCIESAVRGILDEDASDGTVVVTEEACEA